MPPADIVDSHVHFWDPAALHYPWLADRPELRRPFLPADLRRVVGDAPVRRVVLVEANASEEEALDEVRLAVSAPEVAGVVACARLDEPATLPARLDELCARPIVKGIRHNIQG